MTAIFISHSSADNAAAAEMKEWLEAQGHTSLFLDFDPELGIRGGSGWEQTLYRQLRQCQAVIALLTPNWLASKWCFAELVQARERGKAIFPVKVQPCAAHDIFSDIQAIDLTTEREDGYRRLRIGLLERGLDPQDVFDWDPKRPPYPGLLAFEEADAAIFFGRGEEILKTLETLDAQRRQGRDAARFTLVLGASGSGKSSLMRAGLIPRLKKKPADWLPVPPFRPQLDPLDELAIVLAAAFEAHNRPRDWVVIRGELYAAAEQSGENGAVLLDIARDLAIAAQQPDATMLLTIDQAEELFGYTPPDGAARFLRLLRSALERADRRLMAVATLRSDFLGQFQNHPVLQDGEYPHHFRYRPVTVDPMPLRNFPVIIRGPARLAGVELEDGLVEAMVHDTGARDALPLLAFTLRRLYDRFGANGRLIVAEYEALGGLEGAIREEAQRVIADADPSPQALESLRAAFVPMMIRINADGGYARRRARLDDLPPRALPLLRRFVEARLLVTDRDAQGGETIEVAHEALLRTWPLLGGWLAEDQDRLRLLASLQRAAEEWNQAGRRDDLLIHRDGHLNDATTLLANPRFTMPETSIERVYLNACTSAQLARDEAEQEARERRVRDAERIAEEQKKAAAAQKNIARRTRLGLVAVAIVAVVAVWQYVEARRQQQAAVEEAQRANAGRLAIASERQRDQSIDLALLLASEAVNASTTSEAQSVLLSALLLHPELNKILYGHESAVQSVAFSVKGNRVASAGNDSTIRFWDARSGKPIGEPLKGHDRAVTSIVFSSDGKRLASGSDDGSVRLWDVESGTPVGEPLRSEGAVKSVAFSPDGTRIVSGGDDNTVRLWDAESGKALGEPLRHGSGALGGAVRSVTFSPDGKRIVSGGNDYTVRLWDVASQRAIGKPFVAAQGELSSVAFSPDGRRIATAGNDKTIRLWDAESGEAIGGRIEGHEDSVNDVAFSPGGEYLASAGQDDTVRVWLLETGELLGTLRSHTDTVLSVAFSPDGNYLVSGGFDGTVRIWDLWNAESLGSRLEGDVIQANSVAFSPDGKRIAAGGNGGAVRLWDVESRKAVGTLIRREQTANVESVAFSPDGQRLAVAEGTTVRLLDAETLMPAAPPLVGQAADVSSIAFSADGTRIVSASADGTVRLWIAASGQPDGEPLKGHGDRVTSVAFSPTGKRIASASLDKTVRFWDADSHQPIGEPLNADAFGVSCVAFSPDGRRLASGGRDEDVRLWNAETGQPFGQPLTGHAGGVASIAFSPDGKRLASATALSSVAPEHTVRLWDGENGQPIGVPIRGHEGPIKSIAFSPDGKRLASGSYDNTVRLWDVDPQAWRTRACAIANRNLSREEWRRYMGDLPYRKTCPDLPESDAQSR